MRHWILMLPVAIAFEVFAKLLSPILPLFATMQLGPGKHKSELAVEPRLPRWLWWFMMDDHSLWGGREWRDELCPHHKTYRGMVQWLWRNTAVNFGRYALAIDPASPAAWQYKKLIGGRVLINFGWRLDRVNPFNGKAAYVWAIRFNG